MNPQEYVKYVDDFLAADKLLVGADQLPIWGAGHGQDCQRVKLPIEIGGEQRGESLIVDVFPEEDPPRYYIMILVEMAVCRLDFDPPTKIHPNRNAGDRDLPAIVTGAHYHSWNDNKQFFSRFFGVRPVELRNAVELPINVKSFDSAFRWFCAVNNINVGKLAIEMPPRRRLL